MRIEVFDRGGTASEPVRNYVGLRLMSVLDQLVRQVNAVCISLADVQASGGDVGKRCRMLARLAPSGAAAVEMTDSGQYAAIDRAAQELARVVALELARQKPAARSHQKLRADTATLGLAGTRHAPRTMGGS
jgi:hypothetical protein